MQYRRICMKSDVLQNYHSGPRIKYTRMVVNRSTQGRLFYITTHRTFRTAHKIYTHARICEYAWQHVSLKVRNVVYFTPRMEIKRHDKYLREILHYASYFHHACYFKRIPKYTQTWLHTNRWDGPPSR